MYHKSKTLKWNMFIAIAAQSVSLIVSLMMTVIVQGYMTVENYGYWQLFLLYANYSMLFNFGLLDGLYLRELGKDYQELNFPVIGKQFWILTMQQLLLAAVIGMASGFLNDKNRIFVITMAGLYMIFYNLSYFIGYLFQATNNTYIYSTSVIVEKAGFIVGLLFLVAAGNDDFRPYILLYVLCRAVCFLFCLINGREVITSVKAGRKEAVREMKLNVKVGINLLIGRLAGSFVVSCGRMVVDRYWGIEEFSVFSFSVTLVNFFLAFISQISMVLLPALKQTDEKKQTRDFNTLRETLPVLMLGVMIFYVPGKQILSVWFPKYQQSLVYMAILLPICVFDSKMQLVNNTYLKMLRREKMILKINVICVALAGIFSLICAVLFHSPELVMAALVVIVAARSIYSECYLESVLKSEHKNTGLWEVGLSVIFAVVNMFLPVWTAFVVYLLCYLIYLWFHKAAAEEMIKLIQGGRLKKNYGN